jgi:glycosyltransferase involved in cell wall biosynthesis
MAISRSDRPVLTPASIAPHPRYRVVLIHPSAGVNWSGGSEVVAIELARRLSDYFDVELLSGAPCGDFSRVIAGINRTQAYSWVQKGLLKSLFQKRMNHPEIVIEHLTSFLPALGRLLLRPADLVFPHNDYGGLFVAACARRLTGAPVLFTEHTSLIAGGKCLARNLKFRPDHLVVFDQTTANYAQGVRPDQPISILPNGVDLERFHPEGDRVDLGLGPRVVLCVASLNRNNHKRVALAIQAMAQVRDASLLICGDGPDRAYFQALGDAQLGASRFAIRSFTNDQMPRIYRSANIMTLPSLNEPFALTYMEAMASGLPVVTTDDAVRRHIVKDAGILCDVTHLGEYAAAIRQALDQPQLQLLARQNALRFSWNTVAQEYRSIILQLIAARSRRKARF